MRIRAILTDLDGTLLEPDGSLCLEAAEALRILCDRGIPVLPVTSKTAAEVIWLLERLGLPGPAGFENGAGLVERGGRITLHPEAVAVDALRDVAAGLRRETAAPLRTLDEVSDDELGSLTGLTGDELKRARDRRATLPLVVGEAWDAKLSAAAPPHVLLVRGNRFLHLQGRHAKASVAAELLAAAPGDGAVVACGDSPNDLELLQLGDVAVIVPSATGFHHGLRTALPRARVAPAPHGRGWALSVMQLLREEGR